MYDYFDKMLFPSLCEFLDCVDNKRLVAKLFWYKILPAAHNLRYSQGKTGVSLNLVQEWLVGCFSSFGMLTQSIKFYTFHYQYRCLKNVIHQIDSKNGWLLLSASFTAKFGLVFVLTLENAFS